MSTGLSHPLPIESGAGIVKAGHERATEPKLKLNQGNARKACLAAGYEARNS